MRPWKRARVKQPGDQDRRRQTAQHAARGNLQTQAQGIKFGGAKDTRHGRSTHRRGTTRGCVAMLRAAPRSGQAVAKSDGGKNERAQTNPEDGGAPWQIPAHPGGEGGAGHCTQEERGGRFVRETAELQPKNAVQRQSGEEGTRRHGVARAKRAIDKLRGKSHGEGTSRIRP
jgi:hypothetical protein